MVSSPGFLEECAAEESSTYFIPKEGYGKCKSLIWATTTKGPNRVPYGHPWFSNTGVDTWLPILTCCILFNKKLAAHFTSNGGTLVDDLQDQMLLKSHTSCKYQQRGEQYFVF